MIVKRGKGDFTQAYRPCRVSEMVGNDEVKKIIERAFKEKNVPHNFLFHGLSGTGKTTITRIIEMGLNCVEGPTCEPCCECDYCKRIINRTGSLAVNEINAVEVLKDDLKKVLSEFDAYNFGALEGLDKNIFLVDECHGLSNEQAGLFLKYTEDVSKRNYFIFCTTDPDEFLHTLRNRCTIQVEFKKIPNDEILQLLTEICEQEYLNINEEVLKNIVNESDGMPRSAVNKLQQAYLSGKLAKKRILTLRGKNNIIAINPHAHEDDGYTNIIVKTMHEELECYAVINKKYKKDDADLNDIGAIKKEGLETEFLEPIKNFKDVVVDNGLAPLIVLVHGMKDTNMITWGGKDTKVLIGYGQGKFGDKKKPNRPTLDHSDLKKLEAALSSVKLNSKIARTGSGYCAHDKNNLNQLFNLKVYKNYHDPRVRSVQLEIRKTGLRGTAKEAEEIGKLLSEALKGFIQAPVAIIERQSRIDMRKIDRIKPHPLNHEIYGDPEPDDNLKISIQKNGILVPLLISDDDRILSGHRRYAYAKESGIENVQVIVSPLKKELDIEEALIHANIQRQKTREQIAREYAKLKVIEREKSKIRIFLAGGDRKSEEYRKSPTQNSAEPISKGESRKKASVRLGISHDTAEKALKVVNSADELKAGGKIEEAKKLLGILNRKSVNSAYKKAKAISENLVVPVQTAKPTFNDNRTKESIEWATWSWNPVTGCKHGCKYCYARNMAKRFSENFPDGFEPTFYQDRLKAPANTSVPKSNHIGDRNVFVVSMGDLFGDWVDQEWIDAVLESVRKYPQWNYLFLTKNPKRLVDIDWPDNAWVGTTVDCQTRVKPAEEAFEKIKAKVKFLSCEPLSEEITFTNLKLFDWVIIGARSKTSGVPAMQPKSGWVKSLMCQAWNAGCKVYCKPNLKAGVKEYPLSE